MNEEVDGTLFDELCSMMIRFDKGLKVFCITSELRVADLGRN